MASPPGRSAAHSGPGAARPPGPDHGGTQHGEPRSNPRFEDDGRRIFTENDLDGYFDAVPPSVLARDRRRRRRRHAIVLALSLLLIAAVTLTAVQVLRGDWSIPGWEAAPPPEPVLCPAATVQFGQASPVMVYNGTTIGGLAGDVANALEQRQFVIAGVGNRGFSTANMVAVIVSGEAGRQTSLAIQRSIEGAVYLPDGREGDDVDIIMGTRYKGLRPAESVSTEPGTLDCQRLETESPSVTAG